MIVYILFPSCSLPRLDTPVNFTRKHRRAFQCAELSVVSENNRALTQSVPPKKVYIQYIYIYIRGFFGGGCLFCFLFWGFFLLRLCQNPVAFSKFNVRSCTNVSHLSMMIYRSSFFIKQILHYIRISHYFTRPSHSFFALKLNVEYLQMSFVRT